MSSLDSDLTFLKRNDLFDLKGLKASDVEFCTNLTSLKSSKNDFFSIFFLEGAYHMVPINDESKGPIDRDSFYLFEEQHGSEENEIKKITLNFNLWNSSPIMNYENQKKVPIIDYIKRYGTSEKILMINPYLLWTFDKRNKKMLYTLLSLEKLIIYDMDS